MRKLNDQELKVIQSRLESMHIRYKEIYEEIFDHYCTTLEKTPQAEFTPAIAELNETFAWSVVKGMDNELEKSIAKKVQAAQLDYFKFWNLGVKGFLMACLGICLLVICIVTLPSSDLIIVFLVIILVTTIGVFILRRDALSFSLSHKSIPITSAIIIKKVWILNSMFVWIYVLPSILTRGTIYLNTLFVFTIGVITILSVLYSVSLLTIATKLSKPKLI